MGLPGSESVVAVAVAVYPSSRLVHGRSAGVDPRKWRESWRELQRTAIETQEQKKQKRGGIAVAVAVAVVAAAAAVAIVVGPATAAGAEWCQGVAGNGALG